MPKTSAYSEKFKDPRWQQKRLEVFQRDGFKCLSCGASDRQLHVHHLYYIAKRDPWAYPLGSLRTLCDTCHGNDSRDEEDWNPNTQREWEIIFQTGIPCSRHELDFAFAFHQWGEITGRSVDQRLKAITDSVNNAAREYEDDRVKQEGAPV